MNVGRIDSALAGGTTGGRLTGGARITGSATSTSGIRGSPTSHVRSRCVRWELQALSSPTADDRRLLERDGMQLEAAATARVDLISVCARSTVDRSKPFGREDEQAQTAAAREATELSTLLYGVGVRHRLLRPWIPRPTR